MKGSVSLLLSRSEVTAQGSVAYVNGMIAALLREKGWDTRSFRVPFHRQAAEATLPLGLANANARELTHGTAAIALYDDAGAALRTPSRRWAKRNIVLYHGLAYGAGAWMTNPDVDLHCANSPYLACVLRALHAFPDWRGRRCLDPHAFSAITDIALPVPCVDFPQGHAAFSEGADIPIQVGRLLQQGTIVGHALQGRKHDVMATLGIAYWLNEIACQHGDSPIKLLISASALDPERRRTIDAMLAPAGRRCDDYFVPVPHLRQSALFEVMRACRFGLAYNAFPEPFGFHVLESVYHGSPVYTNGVGNNRHLLPPDHGIVVAETPQMAAEIVDSEAYRPVAQRIHADLLQPAAIQASCTRGAEHLRGTWSKAAFARSLEAAFARAERPAALSVSFDELVVAMSPFVRRFDAASGICLNDYANTTLDATQVAAVEEVLGRSCSELDGERMHSLEERHGLFRRGILTLVPTAERPLVHAGDDETATSVTDRMPLHPAGVRYAEGSTAAQPLRAYG